MRASLATMLKQLGVARCYLYEHLERQHGTWNDPRLIDLLTVEVWVGGDLDINNPPDFDLAQQCDKNGKLGSVLGLGLTSDYGEQLCPSGKSA